jgi:hypothetical protein
MEEFIKTLEFHPEWSKRVAVPSSKVYRWLPQQFIDIASLEEFTRILDKLCPASCISHKSHGKGKKKKKYKVSSAAISNINRNGNSTLTIAGGIGVQGNINIGSATANNGALTVAGGVGIGGALNVGGDSTVQQQQQQQQECFSTAAIPDLPSSSTTTPIVPSLSPGSVPLPSASPTPTPTPILSTGNSSLPVTVHRPPHSESDSVPPVEQTEQEKKKPNGNICSFNRHGI